jgi:hypothetical protein
MLEDLTKSMFAENVNSTFNLRQEVGEPLVLELVEIREGAPHPQYEQFSLFFRGPRAVLLPQRTYEFEHAKLGTFLLFLVPVKQDENGVYYEAAFSRVAPQKNEAVKNPDSH